MSKLLCVCVLFIIGFKYGRTMAITGPPLTRYDPCGLGVLNFDKTVMNKVWTGKVNYELYPDIKDTTFEIHFEEPVIFVNASQNYKMTISNNSNMVITPETRSKIFVFNIVVYKPNAVPLVDRFILNNKTLCDKNDKITQTIDSLDVTNNTTNGKSRHVCGRRSMEHTELVTTSAESKLGEWPWHVAVFIKKLNDEKTLLYECGGSIISTTAILTAGHCTWTKYGKIPPNRVLVAAGTVNVSDLESPNVQKFTAKDIVYHPSYVEVQAQADLSVIIVERFRYTEFVQPICLWGPSIDKEELVGKYGTIVGFGRIKNDSFPQMLLSTETLVQSDKTCITYAPNLYPRYLTEFSFCAGYGPNSGTNPRNGDSGGGLVMGVMQGDDKLSWFVRGVLSKCGMEDNEKLCNPKFYTIYTDVAPHAAWIYHHAGIRLSSL